MGWLSGWSYRYAITLDNTLGAAATSFQSNVVLTSLNFDFTKALASGADLRVTDSDGTTLLNFYIASYDGSANGSLWVQKSLSATTSSTVYLYCGNSGASTVSSYDNTFAKLAADGNTLCLVHFDDGSGTTPVDSTSAYSPSLPNGMTWGGGDGGQFGSISKQFASGSYITSNGTNQYASISGLLDTWPAAGCISFWWKSPASAGGNPRIMSKWNGNPGSGGQGLDLAILSGSPNVLYFAVLNAVGYRAVVGQTALSLGVWYHVAITWAGGLFTVYLNGQVAVTLANGGYTPATGSFSPLLLGAYPGPSNFAAQSFDEFIVLNRFPLPEEINAWYHRRVYMKGMEESGRWATNSRTDAITPTQSYESSGLVLEPSVISDSAVGTPGYRMSYTGISGGTPSVCIATSTDGTTWTKYASNPVATSRNGACLFKSGSTYYLWCLNGYSGANMYVRTSTDGVTFGSETLVFASGDQAWLSGMSNMVVVHDVTNSRYIMGLCNFDLGGGTSKAGFATATSPGGTWTLWASNPATSLQYGTGLYAPRSLNFDANGDLHAWGHASYDNTLFPTEIYHWKLLAADVAASNFNNWTKITSNPVIPLIGETFSGGAADQTADPVVLDLGTQVVAYFDVDRNTSGAGQQAKIEQVVFPGSMTNLLTDRPAVSLGTIQSPPSSFNPAWAITPQTIGLGIF
jgi:hypothetical protein